VDLGPSYRNLGLIWGNVNHQTINTSSPVTLDDRVFQDKNAVEKIQSVPSYYSILISPSTHFYYYYHIIILFFTLDLILVHVVVTCTS